MTEERRKQCMDAIETASSILAALSSDLLTGHDGFGDMLAALDDVGDALIKVETMLEEVADERTFAGNDGDAQ
jgi:hypothetical protein